MMTTAVFHARHNNCPVRQLLLKMLDRWNAHDIEGHLEAYWKSSELLVVIDSEQFNGWQQLHDSYVHGYPGATEMGFIQPNRIQVRLLKPDLALALTWWSINFPSSHQKLVGNTTMNFQKFDDGWKIVAAGHRAWRCLNSQGESRIAMRSAPERPQAGRKPTRL
jgi:hypothetical protein